MVECNEFIHQHGGLKLFGLGIVQIIKYYELLCKFFILFHNEFLLCESCMYDIYCRKNDITIKCFLKQKQINLW